MKPTTGMLTMLRPLQFSETDVKDEKLRKWIQALPYGSWDHPIYGMTSFSQENATKMKDNFAAKVHGTDTIHTDFEHGLDVAKGTKASGTILDVDVREDGMWLFVEFTPQATQEIQDGEWSYFSPEYYEVYKDHMDGSVHSDVLTGGALTNKPWVKGMMPINLSEVLVERGVLNRDEQTGEVAWEEHHDPGEDAHQKPKPEDDRSGGSDRINTPPDSTVSDEQEASVEVTAAMLTALGLPEDATQEQIEEAVSNAASALSASEQADEVAKQFSERFPEQHRQMTAQAAELERLRKKDAERDAEAFGRSFSEFVVKVANESGDGGEGGDGDGGTEAEVRKGFSALVCNELTELHKKFSEGTATANDLRPILEKIVAGDGIVEYGERGTSTDETGEEGAANPQEAAIKLSELAWAKVKEAGDDKLSYGDALVLVCNENPELAKLYRDRTGKEG